jgi:hypothetical protein
MEMKVCASLVIGGKITSVDLLYIPKVDEILTFENKDYIIKDVKENWVWEHGQTTIKYCTCVAEEFVRNMVGVPQFKFIQGHSYGEMEEELNKFLYENRHRYAILDISHTMAYIAVQYKLRSEKERYASKAREKSLQESEVVATIKRKLEI